MRIAILLSVLALVAVGCGHDQPQGAAENDTPFGDVPQASQTPGQGRIDSGGGATTGGFPPDSRTNYTQPGTGLRKQPTNSTQSSY